MFEEKIFLNLKGVTFRHAEYKNLEEYLAKEFQFIQIEHKEFKIPNSGTPNEVTFFSHKRYECNIFEAKIEMFILGKLSHEVDTYEEDNSQYPLYTAKYEMIKFACDRGFVLQQLLEKLVLGLGLDILNREWFFERIAEINS